MCPSAFTDEAVPIIDLANVAPRTSLALLDAHSRFPVIRSLLLLKTLGAPVLDGLIVKSWTPAVESAVRNALSKRGWASVLLRSDAPCGYSFKPPGGNLHAIDDALALVRDTLAHGRIPLLLEPQSRFRDEYSGNVLICEQCDWMEWELVGHGFDLGDLNRGYCSPHESFQTYRGPELEDAGLLTCLDVRHHLFIEPRHYEGNWLHRLERVGHLLGHSNSEKEDVREYARRLLLESNQALLLSARSGYSALGYELLCSIHRQVYDVGWKLQEHGFGRGISVIGFSIIQHRGLVFWDVRKYG